MTSELSKEELQSVARRPARGSLKNFLRDLRDLASIRALKATVQEFQRDDILGIAAQLAYYLILALFPFILVLVSLLGTFGSEELASEVLGYFQQVMPEQAYEIIKDFTNNIISGKAEAPGLFTFGILFTIWAASGAFAALINALNRAYDVQETRPFWKVRGIAILMTLGLSVLILIGVLLLVLGPQIGEAIANVFGLERTFLVVWEVARWPVALFFMVFTVAFSTTSPPTWTSLSAGSPGGPDRDALWVLASVGFNFYVSNFGSYNKTYGSIGAVIVLLLYLYISSLTILFGATLNATLVRMKEEISGSQILDAKPANEKPDILDDETVEEIQDND